MHVMVFFAGRSERYQSYYCESLIGQRAPMTAKVLLHERAL